MPAMPRSSTGGLLPSRAIPMAALKSTEGTPGRMGGRNDAVRRGADRSTVSPRTAIDRIRPLRSPGRCDPAIPPTMRRAQMVKAGLLPFHASSTATPQNFAPCADLMPPPSISSMPPAAITLTKLAAAARAACRARVRAALSRRSASRQYCVDGRPAAVVRCHRIRSGNRHDGCPLRSRVYADGPDPFQSGGGGE